jgi:hypothetical protein
VRLSEFWQAVNDEFGGAYGRMIVHDLVLTELGDSSAQDALTRGVPARDVWLALCRASDVPPHRWYGVGLPEPKK